MTSNFNTLFCVLSSKNKVGNLLQDYAVLSNLKNHCLKFSELPQAIPAYTYTGCGSGGLTHRVSRSSRVISCNPEAE